MAGDSSAAPHSTGREVGSTWHGGEEAGGGYRKGGGEGAGGYGERPSFILQPASTMDGSQRYTSQTGSRFVGQRPNSSIFSCGDYYFHKEKQTLKGDFLYHCVAKDTHNCPARASSAVLGVNLKAHKNPKFQKHSDHQPNPKYQEYADLRRRLIERCMKQRLESLRRMYDSFLENE